MELLSHFFPDPPPEGELPPFHVNRIYNNVMRLLSYVRRALVCAAARCVAVRHMACVCWPSQIWPVLDVIWAILAVLKWETPWWSLVCFTVRPGRLVA